MMENRLPVNSLDESRSRNIPERCPRPLYSRDTTQEHQDENLITVRVKVKDEAEESTARSAEPYKEEEEIPPQMSTVTDTRDTQGDVKTEEDEEGHVTIKEEEVPKAISTDGSWNRNTPERFPCPLYSRDSTQEHHKIHQEHEEIAQRYQEFPHGDKDEDLIKTEVKEEAEDPYVKGEEPYREKLPPEIGTDGRYRTYKKQLMVPSEDEVEDDDDDPSGSSEDLLTSDIHQALPSEDLSSVSPASSRSLPKLSSANSHHPTGGVGQPFQKSRFGNYFAKKREHSSPKPAHTEEKTYSCSICRKLFIRKGNLMSHQRTHSGEKPFSCTECGKCFAWKVQLVRHQTTHPFVNPFSCPDCGECFTERETLITHKKTHTMAKPYSCSECRKCFSRKDQLIRHLKIHTGEKPYPCSECGKCFPRISALNRHKKVHTGQRPYTCSECGMSFTERSYLIIHERTHTGVKPYSCSECGESFSQKSTLIRHEKVHTGEKPYSCSVCGKSFTQKGTLVLHKRKHTGECPYACSQCGKCFSRRDYLISHLVFHDKKRIKS